MSPFDPSFDAAVLNAKPHLRSLADQIPASASAAMKGFDLVLAQVTRHNGRDQWLGHACRIGLHGNLACCIEIDATPRVCASLYRQAIGVEADNPFELDEMLCELANVILGHAKTQLDLPECRLSLPENIAPAESLGSQVAPIDSFCFGDQELRISLYP